MLCVATPLASASGSFSAVNWVPQGHLASRPQGLAPPQAPRRTLRHHEEEDAVDEWLHHRLEEFDSVPLEAHKSAYAGSHAGGSGDGGVARRLQQGPYADSIRLGVQVHYDEANIELSADALSFLKDRMAPLLVEEIKQLLYVRRQTNPGGRLQIPQRCTNAWADSSCAKVSTDLSCLAGNMPADFYAPATVCKDGPSQGCVTEGGGQGAEEGVDFVLLVTSTTRDNSGRQICSAPDTDGAIFALGTPCELSLIDGRPVSGAVNICPDVLESEARDEFLGKHHDVLVHETMHALGITSWMTERYIKEETSPNVFTKWGKSAIDTTVSGDYLRYFLVTPKVTEVARAHYGCDSMPGMPLENTGTDGDGTVKNHFEISMVGNELMSGVSEGDRMVLSALTLAQLFDSGWYWPDFSQARTMSTGLNAGCGWVDAQCRGGLTWCTQDRLNKFAPADDQTKYGACNEMKLEPGCLDVIISEKGRCYDAFGNTGDAGKALLYYGAGSRAYQLKDSTAWEPAITTKKWSDAAVCLKSSCNGEGTKLYMDFDGKKVQCPAGKSKNLTWSFVGLIRGTVQCPSQEDIENTICPGLSCKNDCSGAGACVSGKCQCHLGRTGEDCAKWLKDYQVVEPGVAGTTLAQTIFNLATWWSWIVVLLVLLIFLGIFVWIAVQLTKAEPEDSHISPLNVGARDRRGRAQRKQDANLVKQISMRMAGKAGASGGSAAVAMRATRAHEGPVKGGSTRALADVAKQMTSADQARRQFLANVALTQERRAQQVATLQRPRGNSTRGFWGKVRGGPDQV